MPFACSAVVPLAGFAANGAKTLRVSSYKHLAPLERKQTPLLQFQSEFAIQQ